MSSIDWNIWDTEMLNKAHGADLLPPAEFAQLKEPAAERKKQRQQLLDNCQA